MIIADILKLQQPKIYNALVDMFELADIEVEEREPITYVNEPEFPEDDPRFVKYRNIMTEKRSAQK